MKRMKDEQQVFRIGTQVEVTSNEEGFKNSWYECTIISKPRFKNSPNSNRQKKGKKSFYWVKYETIFEEENEANQLRECVHASLIRPLPPTFSSCGRNFEKFEVVEASYRDGWWIGVIIEVLNDGLKYLVSFENPHEEIEFTRDELRAHLSWLGGNKWTPLPIKNVERRPLDGNGSLGPLQLKPILAEVSTVERTPSPAKGLKLATSDDAEARRSVGWENAVQALEAPPLLQSCRVTSSEGNSSGKRKMKASGRDWCFSMILRNNNGNSNENDGKSYEKKKRINDGKCYEKKRRMGPKQKEAVQRFLNSLQDGEEEPGQSGVMHESTIEKSPTSDIGGSHCRSQTNDLQVTEIVDEVIDVEEFVDEQGDCQSKALVWYSNPTLTERSKPHLATLAVNPQSDHNYRRWPFTKRSEMWKVIESMEVFKRVPQMPHFSPLNEHKEESREGIAICMMTKFAYEAGRITSTSLEDLQRTNIIPDILGNLKELEFHGFNTTPLEVYLKALLEKIHRENELQENLEKVESEVQKCQAERAAAERKVNELVEQMKSLQEQVKSAEAVKDLNEQKLTELGSQKDMISSELHEIRVSLLLKFSDYPM